MAAIRPTTGEVMEIFNTAKNKVESIKTEIEDYRNILNKRFNILNHQFNYALHTLNAERLKNGIMDNKIVLSQVEKRGLFDSYGLTIHPKFAKKPRDIFNMSTTTGYIFKNNISVTVNGIDTPELVESIKQDSILDKQFSIKRYNTDVLNIVITPNASNSLGSLNMNLIEIEPFLPGSFNIESIELYSKANVVNPDQSISGIPTVGNQRLVFDAKTEITKIVIIVRLLYKDDTNWYPFGLKHLYFYDADFRNDSYLIARIDKAQTISYIYDDIVIKNQFGLNTDASCEEEDIQFYTTYNANTGLSHEIELSTIDNPSYVASNIKSCFMYLPINTAIVAVIPNIKTE